MVQKAGRLIVCPHCKDTLISLRGLKKGAKRCICGRFVKHRVDCPTIQEDALSGLLIAYRVGLELQTKVGGAA